MDQKNLNVNTPNANLLRRGSAISMANELQMNNLLHFYALVRVKSCFFFRMDKKVLTDLKP